MPRAVGFLQRAGPGHQSYPQGIEDHLSLTPDPDTLGWTPWKETFDLPLILTLPPQVHPQRVIPSLIRIWVEMARPPAGCGHCRRIFRCAVFPEAAQMDAVRRLPLEVAGPHAVYPPDRHRGDRMKETKS